MFASSISATGVYRVRCIIVIIMAVWLLPVDCKAQKDSTTQFIYEPDEITRPDLALKWSPFHLYYFFPSWQFALEHRLTNRMNIQYDAGWIADFRSFDLQYQNPHGFRGSVELKYFLPVTRMIPMYVAAEYYYHDIRFDRTETVGINCIDNDCDYYQYVSYPVKSREQGPSFKFGLLLFPAWHVNRSLFFDFNGGFAFRFIDYKYGQRPEGENIRYFGNTTPEWLTLAPDESLSTKVRFVLGVRIGLRLM